MLASLQHINNLIYVEVFVPQVFRGQRLPFPYVDALLAYPCVGIVSFLNVNIDNDISGNTELISEAAAPSLYVTLVDKNSDAFISQMPYNQLTASNFNQPVFKFSKARYLDIENSYLTVASVFEGDRKAVFIFEYLRNV